MQNLLRTKLFAPRPPLDMVTRPHLIHQLNQGMRGKLSLVMAPAGYGKTTLVTTWLRQLETQNNAAQIMWLSIDENDNDVRRFFTHFIGAFCQLDDTFTMLPETFLQNAGGEVATLALMTELLNHVASYPDDLILILDDYHEIATPPIHEAIAFWLDHQPPNFHLVITSRSEPPLPLPRLRVRRQVTEIETNALRFNRAETADFLNQLMALNLSAEQVSQLDSMTEGWVASLQLTAISLQNKADPAAFINTFKGNNRHIVDYLANEVLYRQPIYIRDFLLQTAVLERFNVSLCNAVTEQENSQQILDELDQARLFLIPLDDQRQWYRYHHLFAEYLQAESRRTDAKAVSGHHQRASHWYETNGFIGDAIQHAFASGSNNLARPLLEQNARTLHWLQGDLKRLWQWLQRLPETMIQTSPQLLVTTTRLKMELFGDYSLQIDTGLDRAASLLAQQDTGQSPDTKADLVAKTNMVAKADMVAEIAITRASLARFRGNLSAAIKHSEDAVALSQTNASNLLKIASRGALNSMYYLAGDIEQFLKRSTVQLASFKLDEPLQSYARYNFLSYILDALRLHGDLKQAEQLYKRLEVHFQQRPSLGSATLGLIWAEILRERNELDQATDAVNSALDILKPHATMALVVRAGIVTQARILQAQHKGAAALALLDETEHAFQVTNNYSPAARLRAIRAQIGLQQGDISSAQAWVRASNLQLNAEPTYLLETDHLVFARVLLAEGNLLVALQLLDKLETAVTENGRFARLIEVFTLKAIAHQNLGKSQQAASALTRAIELAAPAGFVRVFLDEGKQLIPLLKQLAARNVAFAYIQHLLSLFAEAEQSTAHSQARVLTASTPTLQAQSLHLPLSPLTERELTTLRYLATDLKIPSIAEQLIVAPSTVRTYVKNIYSKLDAHSRIEAVNRGRSLGLIR